MYMKILMCAVRVRRKKVLIIFDAIIADMISNKKKK